MSSRGRSDGVSTCPSCARPAVLPCRNGDLSAPGWVISCPVRCPRPSLMGQSAGSRGESGDHQVPARPDAGRPSTGDPYRPTDHSPGRQGRAAASAQPGRTNPGHDRPARIVRRRGESPAPGWSQYMVSTNPAQLRRTGCRAGAQTRTHIGPLADVLTVLDFGRPARRHYVFGTMLFGTGGYRSTKAIARGVEGYEAGYVKCARSSRSHLELAIGTSNFRAAGHAGPRARVGGDGERGGRLDLGERPRRPHQRRRRKRHRARVERAGASAPVGQRLLVPRGASLLRLRRRRFLPSVRQLPGPVAAGGRVVRGVRRQGRHPAARDPPTLPGDEQHAQAGVGDPRPRVAFGPSDHPAAAVVDGRTLGRLRQVPTERERDGRYKSLVK